MQKSVFSPPREANGRFMKFSKARRLGLIPKLERKRTVRKAVRRKSVTTSKKAAGEALSKVPKVDFGKNKNTAQIYSTGMEFAFMSKIKEGVYKQIHTFVLCKDFLHDLVWASVNKTNWSIYGFTYDHKKDLPLDRDNTVFAFRNKTLKGDPEKFHTTREACQQFLNGCEAQMGLAPTQIFQIPHEEGPCWIIVGDKGWQHAPPLVGLYTLLIRVGTCHVLGETHTKTLEKIFDGELKMQDVSGGAGKNDPRYLKNAKPAVLAMLKRGIKMFHPKMEDNYPAKLRSSGVSIHHGLGPVAFNRAKSLKNSALQKTFPHWFRDSVWK